MFTSLMVSLTLSSFTMSSALALDAGPTPEAATETADSPETEASIQGPSAKNLVLPLETPPLSAEPPSAGTALAAALTPTPPAPVPEEPRNNGGVVGYGAMYGAYAGGMGVWLVGEALEESEADHTTEGVFFGVLGGAVTGATVSHLLSKGAPGTRDATGLLYSGTAMGFYYGDQLGRVLIPVDAPGANERVRATGMAGSMAGLGLGLAMSHRAGPVGHQVHYMAANGIGWLAGRGVGDMAGWDPVVQRRQQASVELASSLALGGVATLTSRAGLESPTASTVSLGLVDGAWFGAWAPYLFTDNPAARQVAGGLELGVGLGYGTTVAMAALGQPSGQSTALQTVGLAAGSALGAGVPLALGREGPSRVVVGPMLGVGAAGQALGAAIAPRYRLDANDQVLLASLEGWTAYQALGWSTFSRHTGATDSQALGYALTAGGAGTLTSMVLVPTLDVSPQGSAMLLSGGAWGTWFGAWGSRIAGADADTLWLASLTAGDGALLASAVAQGAGWQPTWRQAAAINGGGLVGAAAGGLVGAIALYNPDDWTPISASVVAGSAAGLVAGGLFSSLPSSKSSTNSSTTANSSTDKRGLSALAARLPFDTRAQVLPWTSEDSTQPGVWLQLDLTER